MASARDGRQFRPVPLDSRVYDLACGLASAARTVELEHGRVDVGVPDVVLDRDDAHGVDREGAEKVCLRSWKRSGRDPARLRAVFC
jgi:hypothetical protein